MREPTNMRRWRRSNERRLVGVVILTLVLVGGGLIGAIYGPPALATALPCLALGAAGVLLPYALLVGVETWRRRAERE